MFKRKAGAFMGNSGNAKSTLKIIAIIAAVAALAAGIAVAITKLCQKKKTKKYYIECDCSDTEPVLEQCDIDEQEIIE